MNVVKKFFLENLIFRFLCLVFSCIVVFQTGSIALAQTAFPDEQVKAFQSGVRYFNTQDDIACAPTLTGAGGTGVDRFLQVLAYQESRGDPTVGSPGGSNATGKYQYIGTTWHSVAQTYYPPALQYAAARDAPEEVQDAVAYLEYTSKFNSLGGDLFKMFVSHYVPAALDDPSLLDVVPPGNVQTPRQYAEMGVQNINDGVGKDIPLKYASAPDFQTWLAKVGGATTVSSPTSTTVGATQAQCAPSTPSGSFVFYSQYDAKWVDHPYGTSSIGPSGCGPTSVAEVVATLVDKSVTPVETADWGTQNGAYVTGQGTIHQIMLVQGPEHWGLTSTPLGTDMDKAINVIKGGGLVIAAGTGPVPFTQAGHILVIRGVTASGKLLLGDPAHPEANQKEWDSSELLPYIGAMFGVTK